MGQLPKYNTENMVSRISEVSVIIVKLEVNLKGKLEYLK
jgi:hypothetical protein